MALPPGQAKVGAFLAGLAGPGLAAVETHISAVFRGADTVWKLKKAVRLPFLDFSGVEARRRFLERELALNAPFVPGLYRDVVAVTREADGLALGGRGEAVDWVLRMARVPEAEFLDAMAAAGRLDAPSLLALADVVAAMHGAQALTPVADPAGRMRVVVAGNAAAARAAGLDEGAVTAWERGVEAALDGRAAALRVRGALVRRAHGDLHLGNLLMWRGRPAPFDALEFDEELATIDPGYDLAFLLMDLDLKVSRAAANLVLCRYVARTGDAGLVGGLTPFLSIRAMIRAHVEAARGREVGRLLAAALGYLEPARAVVLAVGGLMGTGKSTLARAVAPLLGVAPGALVLRSDEVRKRLFGVTPEVTLPEEAYSGEAHRRTAAAVLGDLRAAVAGGQAVVVDGTFFDPAMRAEVAAVARRAGVAFMGVWLDAPMAELERRVAARRGDASDATVAVLRKVAGVTPPGDWLRIDALDAEAVREEVQRRLAML